MTIFKHFVRIQTMCHKNIPLIYRPASTLALRTNNRLNIMTRLSNSSRYKSSSTEKDGFEDLDKPIQYTTSAASEWKAERTHSGALHPDVPDYQPFVVVFSVGMMLLYFCVLREENDIDEEMKIPLWEKVPGLEKKQILNLLQYSETHNISKDALLTRLAEIEELERKIEKMKKEKENSKE